MVHFRTAEPRDAEAAVDVVRRSIIELCVADHSQDAETLAKWLDNKTPSNFTTWLADDDNFSAVGVEGDSILGVGIVKRNGEIVSLYLAPHAQRRGIGKALHEVLEQKAKSWKLKKLHLGSTIGARPFYEAIG